MPYLSGRRPGEGAKQGGRCIRFTFYKDDLLWLECGDRLKPGKSGTERAGARCWRQEGKKNDLAEREEVEA